LQRPKRRRPQIHQQRGGQGADVLTRRVKLGAANGVDAQVQPDPEQLSLSAGEAFGQLAGIGCGGVKLGVCQPALASVGAAAGLQAGELAAQPVGRQPGRDRVNVDGDVELAGKGQQRLEPARSDLAGIADDGERSADPGADGQRPGADLHRIGAGQARGRRTGICSRGRMPGRSGEAAGQSANHADPSCQVG